MRRRTAWGFAAATAATMTAGGIAVALPAFATTDSPYVTVAWSYQGYPDITAPQPFLAVVPGANLHAFDQLAASPEHCRHPIQVDVYQRTDKHGVSWESLKPTGSLLYGTDGGYLGYGAGVGTPYRVINPEDYPCTTPAPTPTPTESAPTTPVPVPTDTPTPTGTPTPTAPPTTSTPAPSGSPSPSGTPTPAAPTTAPATVPTVLPTSSPSGTATAGPIPSGPRTTSSGGVAAHGPASSPRATAPDELAYTGWSSSSSTALGIGIAAILVGAVLMFVPRLRRLLITPRDDA
jgi:hypothetical protein